MKTVYFSPSKEAFRLGDSETVSFFDLTTQKQPLKVMQFLKNRQRLAGRAQSFPEIVSRVPSHSCTTVQNQMNFMPHSKAHLCTHLRVHSHLPTASPLSDPIGRHWTIPILEEKRTAKRKGGRHDIPVNPTCFWTSKPEVCENHKKVESQISVQSTSIPYFRLFRGKKNSDR